jgi:hypothetical protein
VDGADLADQLEKLLDQGLVYHGFTAYMRDYELVASQSPDPRAVIIEGSASEVIWRAPAGPW